MDTIALHEHDRKTIQTPLASDLIACLIRTFSAGSEPATATDIDVSAQYLLALRERRHWIACGCTDPTPIMVPRLRLGNIGIVRLPEHAHAPGCPLEKARWQRLAGRTDELAGPDYRILHADTDVEHPARLMRRLGQLLDAALASAIGPVRGSDIRVLRDRRGEGRRYVHGRVAELYAGLTEAGRTLPFGGEVAGVRLTGRFSECRELRRYLAEPDAISPLCHQGVYLGLVDDLGERRTGWTHARAPNLTIWLCHPTGLRHEAGGPYLGCAVFAPYQGKVKGIAGVAVPIQARGMPIPINSAEEREGVAMLLDQMVYWQSRHDVDATLDRLRVDGVPDGFVIESPRGGRFGVFFVAERDQAEATVRIEAQRAVLRDEWGLPAILYGSAERLSQIDMRKRMTAVALGKPAAG
jgi:hypothetical protein